jgi:hypothetical protein
MTSPWEAYPITYRQQEATQILAAVQTGECASVVGLSGSGKSNLLGFLAHREDAFPHPVVLIDCNRLRQLTFENLFQLIRLALGDSSPSEDEFSTLDTLINQHLEANGGKLTPLLDRFETLADQPEITSSLRALRDLHKYRLTYVTATRRPLDPHSELAELTFAHTLWLGPLSQSDTYWNVARYARRIGVNWGEEIAQQMLQLTRGYPSLLRATCEAHAAGTDLTLGALRKHPAIQRRLEEFWADDPSHSDLQASGLDDLPLLKQDAASASIDTAGLTEKEYALLSYFQAHPEVVCTKDELVRAVWPEDVIFERGIRDDSLAQLVRRLRLKIEPDPSNPRHILTIPGRGYRYVTG